MGMTFMDQWLTPAVNHSYEVNTEAKPKLKEDKLIKPYKLKKEAKDKGSVLPVT